MIARRFFPRSVSLPIILALAMAMGTLTTLWALGAHHYRVAQAANFTVNSAIDAVDANPGDGVCNDGAGNCTLRATIMETIALPGADTITLPAGIYTLSVTGSGEDAGFTGDLDITDDLTIIGAGSATTIIDGGAVDRVFHILPGNNVAISGVTIRNGSMTIGGGIFNDNSTLTVTNSTVSGNTAVVGGGLTNDAGGTVTLIGSTIINNSAGGFAGGILNGIRSTLTVTNSIISNNTASSSGGGGIFSGEDATMVITKSAISGNTASDVTAGHGGGIVLDRGGTLTMTNSTVSDNTAAGKQGVGSGGIEINDGGVFHPATVILTNSTVSGNTSALDAGGIRNDGGTLTLINSTISGNTSARNAGGIFNIFGGTLTITNSTVSNNHAAGTGGGLNSRILSPTVDLANSIIAGNTASLDPDCSGDPVTSLGHNLIGDDSGCSFTATPADLVNVGPLLGPLQDNGGPTETHALLPGSPAIDNIPAADCVDLLGNPITTDQRGVSRPQGPACDIGAYEAEAVVDLSIAKVGSPDPVVAGADLTYTLTATNEITGANVATGVFVVDTLPAGVIFKSAIPSQGITQPVTGSDVVWEIGDLLGGQSETLDIVVTVYPSIPDGTVLTNTGGIDGDQEDPNPGNDDVVTTTTVISPSVVEVVIDIKPGSDPNSINCKNNKGVIPVAILTTTDFDAATVDHTTVTFVGASETHVDKKTGEPRRHEEDVDGDGDTDLVFHFRSGDTSLACDSTEGTLIGETFNGQDIDGTDAVRMVGNG